MAKTKATTEIKHIFGSMRAAQAQYASGAARLTRSQPGKLPTSLSDLQKIPGLLDQSQQLMAESCKRGLSRATRTNLRRQARELREQVLDIDFPECNNKL